MDVVVEYYLYQEFETELSVELLHFSRVDTETEFIDKFIQRFL